MNEFINVAFFDRVELCDKSLKRTPEGYLQLEGIIARSGIQEYTHTELGLNVSDANKHSLIVLERPIDEVTDPMSIASFMLKPITNDHPSIGFVDISNFKVIAKGMITSVEATNEGQLKASLLITDFDLANAIEKNKRELSAGYSADIYFSDDGVHATQRKIRGNHVAFVDKGRCGTECRIIDRSRRNDILENKPANKLGNKQEDITMAKLRVNDVEIEIQDSAVPMVQSVIKQRDELLFEVKKLTDCVSTIQAKLDAEIENSIELKKLTITDEKVIALAEELTELWASTKLIDSKFDAKGKSPAMVKRAVIVAKIGDSMKDKDDAYISARFDVLVEGIKTQNNDTLTNSLNVNDRNNTPIDLDSLTKNARQRKIDRAAYKVVGDQGHAADK